MGLLIFQRKDEGWHLSITEEWAVSTSKDAGKIQEFLMSKAIPYKVDYSFELVHIHFEKSIYRSRDYDTFKEVLNVIMDYKKKYGDFKDLGELKKIKKSFRGITEDDLK